MKDPGAPTQRTSTDPLAKLLYILVTLSVLLLIALGIAKYFILQGVPDSAHENPNIQLNH